MRVLRRYVCAVPGRLVRHYVIVGDDTGRTVELNELTPLTDEQAIAIAEQAMAMPEPDVEVEAEDGVVV